MISNPIEPAERNPRENEDPIVPDVPLGVATTEPPHVEPRAESPESVGEIVRQAAGSGDEAGRRGSEPEVASCGALGSSCALDLQGAPAAAAQS